jgi:hypothetical protein
MNCPECTNKIELVTKKNEDTGMLFNQWECEVHGKVDPTQVTIEQQLVNFESDWASINSIILPEGWAGGPSEAIFKNNCKGE